MLYRYYAEALSRAVHGKDGSEKETLFQNFRNLLTRRGHTILFPSILREFENITQQQKEAATVTLSVAKLEDADTFRAEVEAVENVFGSKETFAIVEDSMLVGGWRVERKDALYDASYRRGLLELYRKFTR